MAFSQTGNTAVGTANPVGLSTTLAFPNTLAVNSLLIARAWYRDQPTTCAFSDTRSNTWTTTIAQSRTGQGTLFMAWALNTAGAVSCTVTADPSTALDPIYWDIEEWIGVDLGDALEASSSAQAGSGSPNSGNISTVANDTLLIGAVGCGLATITAGTNVAWTLLHQEPTGATSGRFGSESFVPTAPQTNVSAQFALSTAVEWCCGILAFNAAAGGGSVVPALYNQIRQQQG